MQVIIEYDGKTYKSAIDERDHEEAAEAFYKVSPMEKFKMELEDGSMLLLSKIAVQSAVIIFKK